MWALSLWQPWASLIFLEDKKHETREWPCPARYIGTRIIIHAAKNKQGFRDVAHIPGLLSHCAREFGEYYPGNMPLGAAIGTVIIEACVSTNDFQPDDRIDFMCGNYLSDRYAWRLSEPQAFRRPIPMVGRQGFWRPAETVPGEIAA